MEYLRSNGLNPDFLSNYYISGTSTAWHMCRGKGDKRECLQEYLSMGLNSSVNWENQKMKLKDEIKRLFNKKIAIDVYIKLVRFLGMARFYKRKGINSCVEFAKLVAQSELLDRYSILGIAIQNSPEYITYAGSQQISLKRAVIACPNDEKVYELPIWGRESVVGEKSIDRMSIFCSKFPMFKLRECKTLSPLNEIYEGKSAKEFDKTLLLKFTEEIDDFDFISYTLSDIIRTVRSIRLENFVSDPFSTKEPYLSLYGVTYGYVTKEETVSKDTFGSSLIRVYLEDESEKSNIFFFYLAPTEYNYLHSSFNIKNLLNKYLGILFKLPYNEKVWGNKIELIPLRIWLLEKEEFLEKIGLAYLRLRQKVGLKENSITEKGKEIFDNLVKSKRIEEKDKFYIYKPKKSAIKILEKVNPIFNKLKNEESFEKIFKEFTFDTRTKEEIEKKSEKEEYNSKRIINEIILLLRIMFPNTLTLESILRWLSYFFPEDRDVAINLLEPLIESMLRRGIISQRGKGYKLNLLRDQEMESAFHKSVSFSKEKFLELERFVTGIIRTHPRITKRKVVEKIISSYQLSPGLGRKVARFLSFLESEEKIIIDDSGIVFT